MKAEAEKVGISEYRLGYHTPPDFITFTGFGFARAFFISAPMPFFHVLVAHFYFLAREGATAE